MDNGQLLEKFRHCARDLKNNLSNLQMQIESAQKQLPEHNAQLTAAVKHADVINQVWTDFATWIHLSTLDNIEQAKENCAPGQLQVEKKLVRYQALRKSDLRAKKLRLHFPKKSETMITSYIQYFELLLDLLLSNAIKYAPASSDIEIEVCREKDERVRMTISSMGPYVEDSEKELLGTKGFRTDNARDLQVTGQGYGLYNAQQILLLLGGELSFDLPRNKIFMSNIAYGSFNIHIYLPDDVH